MNDNTPILDKTGGTSLRSGFLESAAKYPSNPALVLGERAFSYAEMEERARVWAHAIVDDLGRPAQRVGVFAYRSEVAYAGVLAALFSGAAFVPLNKRFPIERTRAMIRLADLDAILVDRGSADQLEEVLSGLEDRPVILLPDQEAPQDTALPHRLIGRSELTKFAPLEALPPVIPEEIAYLLFTSGSTGKPKGVPVTHGNVCHFLDVMVRRYGIAPEDRFSQTFEQTFDLSIFDLFVPWQRGACVYGMQSLDLLAPARFVAKHDISVWFSVPSIPALMRQKNTLKPNVFPTLRWSLFCGEPLPRASAEAWQAAAPNSVVENLYGPTELTLACLLHRWDPETSPPLCTGDVVPIGRPYEGLGVILVDDQLRPVPDGEPGELCVCGRQTVPGYWRNPNKTRKQFVRIEIPGNGELRFYRTGDRVMRLPDGEYVFLGRIDNQLKVRGGYRVEASEIEAVLRRHAAVVDAVAVGWPVVDGTIQGIVAFITGKRADPTEVLAAARRTLPDYMVPRAVRVMDKMPYNANGKIDRKKLVEMLDAAHVSEGTG
jgi:amino acid adenylation domain-containing protein